MVAFINKLKHRLSGELPGEGEQYRMAPEARPRFRDSLSDAGQIRQSAVLLYLFPLPGEWGVVLMKRTAYDGPHSGQVGIPGGRLEPGEDHRQAALREFAEETGVDVDRRQLLGRLSELYIPTSSFLVTPFVAYADEPPSFDPDPVEVAELIALPLSLLRDDAAVKWSSVSLSSGTRVRAPYYDVEGHRVWGATAMILSEFKAVLHDL